MIDIENEVFTAVSKKLKKAYPKAYFTGEYVKAPPSFPCVSLIEKNNLCYERTQTGEQQENHSLLLYEADVYSNRQSGKKAECKAIAALIDGVMASLGFTRVFFEPIPNELDATVFRIKARYRAVVSKDKVIYRR